MRDVRALYERLRALPWPALVGRIGDCALYETLLVGSASRVANGGMIDMSKVPVPDQETVAYVAILREKYGLSAEEAAFLEYFDLLGEIRLALAGEAAQS